MSLNKNTGRNIPKLDSLMSPSNEFQYNITSMIKEFERKNFSDPNRKCSQFDFSSTKEDPCRSFFHKNRDLRKKID